MSNIGGVARRLVAICTCAPLLSAALVGGTSYPASAASASKPLRTLVAQLPVVAENRVGYARSKFRLWIDADHDGCDTRKEVLIAEAVKVPHIGASCALSDGRWRSLYDNRYTNDSTTFDVDHVVPLAEAWDSGARAWTSTQRENYANDLGDPRSLIAVSASSNRSKGDQDPADWIPPYAPDRCHYVDSRVAVKVRWRLTVDLREKKRLIALAAGCPNATISVTIASTTISNTTTTIPTGANCSPAYPDFCIPPPPPDLDCADVAPHHDFTVLPPDPHHFDGNHNGRGCES